ncbi:unnamed protein product [Diatraea saccharalis]|uniref:Regulatory protein zeste n=1 Tax=Diatraea saccharalis TaxID=40085 RepID=A0A9N9WD48_9NEOP|nr:unnamed protein product [Diatraea saccharalis]
MSQKPKRDRGANYTAEEKALLADLVFQYKDIVDSKTLGGAFLLKKKEAWKAITTKYNSNSTTGPRETEQLKVLYDNMKQKSRKKVGELNNSEQNIGSECVIDDALKQALQHMKEDKVQMNKSCSSDWKPQVMDSDTNIPYSMHNHIEPLTNPYDSASIFFKDEDAGTNCTEPVQIIEVDPLNPPVSNLQTVRDCMSDESLVMDQNNIRSPPLRVLASASRKINKGVTPQNTKSTTTSETFKKLYFKKKCQNAKLEQKKIMIEVMHLKKEHQLKIHTTSTAAPVSPKITPPISPSVPISSSSLQSTILDEQCFE